MHLPGESVVYIKYLVCTSRNRENSPANFQPRPIRDLLHAFWRRTPDISSSISKRCPRDTISCQRLLNETFINENTLADRHFFFPLSSILVDIGKS
jgi:hypothetical protein